MKTEILVLTPEQLQKLLKKAVLEALNEHEKKQLETRVYNKKQTAQLIGRSYGYVNKLIAAGILEQTADGRILHSSIENYLKGINSKH